MCRQRYTMKVEYYRLDHQFAAQRQEPQNRWVGIDTLVVCSFPHVLCCIKYIDGDAFL